MVNPAGSSAMPQPKITYYRNNRTEYTEACFAELAFALNIKELDPSADLEEQLRAVEIVVDLGGWGTREMIDAAVDVKLWQVLGTGLDHCDVEYILHKGIALSHTPGDTSALALSESAMMYILMLTRRYHTVRDLFFQQQSAAVNGTTLDGLVLGIVGFGASGRQLAKQARCFGMRIEAIDVRPLENDIPEQMRPDFYGGPADLDAMIGRCDVLSLHLHLTPETKHIIDRQRLALMKPTAFLINVARGLLVDEDALADALLTGKIGGAGIDVFGQEPPDASRPEYHLPNIIVTPHTAGQTDDTVRRRCQIVVENVQRLAAGDYLLHQVDASAGLGKF